MASANAEGRYLWSEHTDHHRQHALRRAAADLDFLLPHIRPGADVVDLGCGPGSLTCDVAEMVAPGSVLGIDISAQPSQSLRQRPGSGA
jgi:ubiquinone/menaquinone biosynthesis C-methylase UbiE